MTDFRTVYRGRRALVLGASGFIGRWVARALTRAGAELICAVRDPEGSRSTFAEYGIGGEVITLDVTDLPAVTALVQRLEPAVTFNLVGYGIDRSERDERLSQRINADLPEALASALAGQNHQGWPGSVLLHTGSALEYGEVGGHLLESVTENPTTLYGLTKLAGTRALARAAQATGLRTLTARLFTVYGPGEHDGRLLPTLLAGTRQPGEILLSAGLQRRDFTYVGDVVEGLLRLGASSAPAGATVNLATGKLSTVREFIEVAAQVLQLRHNQLRFGAVPTRPDEMEHQVVSIARLQALLGWVPATDPATGVRRTASWYGIGDRAGVSGTSVSS